MAEENTNTGGKTRMQRFKERCKGSLKISFILFTAVHIAMIVIAAMNLHNCPAEPDIPKYLLALGIIGIVTKLISLFRDFIIKYTKVTPILSLMATVELAILIVASYYVYREYPPDYDPASNSSRYCNKTAYLFAFVYVTIVYALLLIFILAISCFVFGIVLVDKYIADDETKTRKDEESQEKKELASV